MRSFTTALVLLAAVLACRGGDSAGEGGGEPPPVVGARTALATRRPFVETVDAIGTIPVGPSARAALSPPADCQGWIARTAHRPIYGFTLAGTVSSRIA